MFPLKNLACKGLMLSLLSGKIGPDNGLVPGGIKSVHKIFANPSAVICSTLCTRQNKREMTNVQNNTYDSRISKGRMNEAFPYVHKNGIYVFY